MPANLTARPDPNAEPKWSKADEEWLESRLAAREQRRREELAPRLALLKARGKALGLKGLRGDALRVHWERIRKGSKQAPARVAYSLSRRPRVAAMMARRKRARRMRPEHVQIAKEAAAHGGVLELWNRGVWTYPGCEVLSVETNGDEVPAWYAGLAPVEEMIKAGWFSRGGPWNRIRLTDEARVAALLDGAPPPVEDGKGEMSDKLRDAIKAVGSMAPEHSRTFLPASSVLSGKSHGELPPIRPQPKPPPRVRSEDYLAFVRSFPCMSCGSRVDVQASHHSPGGKEGTAKSKKVDDLRTVPLCYNCHIVGWHGKRRLPGLGCATLEGTELEIHKRMVSLLVQFYRERRLIDALDEEVTLDQGSS